MKNVLWFDEIGMTDLPAVGGKNASLGEMVSHLSALGVRVPGGFATTADISVCPPTCPEHGPLPVPHISHDNPCGHL